MRVLLPTSLPLSALLLAALLAAPSAGQGARGFGDTPEGHLSWYDARRVDRQPNAAVREALASARTELQRNARAAEIERMQAAVAGLRVDDHELFGTPSFVRSTLRLLTPPRDGADALLVVHDFVAEHPALFEIDPAEVELARARRDFVTRHNGVRHLTLQQEVSGLELFGAVLKASVTERGELINVSSSMLPRGAGFEVPAVSWSAADAIRSASDWLGIELFESPRALSGPSGPGAARTWAPGATFRADVPLSSELVVFPLTRLDLRPAWSLVLPEKGVGNTYEVLVDATSGDVLRVWNRLHYLGGSEAATFNVYTSDSPKPGSPGLATPTGFQFPEVPRALVTVRGVDVGAFSPNGWIDDGVNETLGNNVDAHTDLDDDDNPDLPRPQGSPYRVFDFPLDLTMSPSTYRDAAVTQLFYLTNVYHDALYALGFDEVAGNFQQDNFGLGGFDQDLVEADAQDGSGVNNANFGTSGFDGSPARMQMYVWNDPSPDVDGDLDADVVFHEFSHGLSIRLHEGTVFGQQSGGMGEGWGDYFGLSLNAEPGDDPHANYAMGAYATSGYLGTVDNYYFGIRRYPYSTDMSVSPLTYKDTDANQLVLPPGIPLNPNVMSAPDSVHRLGEIWCNTLVECRANLWDDLGFAGNALLMQLVVDGMKLSPNNPNMLQARDAILQADLVNNGGANLGNLWEGFAKRGMGGTALSPSGSTSSGVVEAFDVPGLIQLQFAAPPPTQLVPEAPTVFDVQVTQIAADPPIPGSGLLYYSIDGGPYTSVPMVEGTPNLHTATLPGSSCFEEVSFYVSVDTMLGTTYLPAAGPNGPLSATVTTGTTTFLADDVEVDTGWIVGDPSDDATTGVWERVDPVGTAAQPENDVTADPGVTCWVTGQGVVGGSLGDDDVDNGQTTLTSPLFSAPSAMTRVGYWRWYSNNTGGTPNADVFTVEISNDDGASWTTLEVVGPTGPDTGGGWIFHDALVSDFVAPTNLMRLRFIAADEGSGSLVEAGVDELSVFEEECSICQPDLGFGGPGTAVLSLCGPPLTPGTASDLLIEAAPPSAPAWLLFGGSQIAFPILGGTILTGPPGGSVFLGNTDGSGELFLPGIDGGSAAPVTLTLQGLVLDLAQVELFAITNGVGAEFLP